MKNKTCEIPAGYSHVTHFTGISVALVRTHTRAVIYSYVE